MTAWTLVFCAVGLVGCAVMAGWMFGWQGVLAPLPGSVTMKFGTAASFTAAGLGLAMRTRLRPGVPLSLFDAGIGWALVLFMGFLFIQALSPAGIWEKHFADAHHYTERPNVPSLGTLAAFTLIGWYLILNQMDIPRLEPVVGAGVVVIAAMALVGYLLDMPALYYYEPHISTGMAVHTALLFLVLGIGIIRMPSLMETGE